eukprot:m.189840 g.189840  ORF g.189840 m.189840 type:complete len:415 (+) comp18534_c0_seq2:204-1448(+)
MQSGVIPNVSAAGLRRFFTRFSRDDLVSVIKHVGTDALLVEQDLSLAKTQLITRLIYVLGTVLTYDQVARFDLYYFQQRSTRKWKALKLSNSENRILSISDAGILQASLSRHLALYFDHHVLVQQFKNALWVRIFVQDSVVPASQLTSHTNTIFLIYSPHTPYVMTTAIKKSQHDFICQALVASFHCNAVEDAALSGKDYTSLLDLLVNKTSQGVYAEYRLNMHDSNPLAREAPQQRQRSATFEENLLKRITEASRAGAVVADDMDRAAERADANDAAFGSLAPPQLQKIEVTLNTRFSGDCRYSITAPFVGKVKFEGPSVIEGLKQLVAVGAADTPLPPVLANLHSSGQSKFAIYDRDAAPRRAATPPAASQATPRPSSQRRKHAANTDDDAANSEQAARGRRRRSGRGPVFG